MRFIHVADLHLGAKPEGILEGKDVRGKELWDSFERILDICEEQGTDLLLIVGDMFHRQPLMRELKELNYLFSKLTKTQVVWIAGNHDYVKPESYYRNFEWNTNVHPLLDEQMGYVEFPELHTCVYGFSYHKKEITEPLYDQEVAKGRQDIEILLAHGGDEKHIPLNRNRLFDLGYDYVALGHIHKPEILVENAIAYAGALEPIDKNDTGVHGYISGVIDSKGTQIEFVPFATRTYIHATIEVDANMTNGALREKIRAFIVENGEKNIYKFLVKGYCDADIHFDTEKQNYFGNILEIIDQTVPQFDFEKIKNENQGNLLGRFIESFEGCEPGSVEYRALYEGVQALLPERRVSA